MKVVSARGLAPMDRHGTSDPYAKLKVGRFTGQTAVVKENLNPVWEVRCSGCSSSETFYTESCMLCVGGVLSIPLWFRERA